MLTLSGMIVANVGTDYINTYLKSKKYAKEDEGKAVEYWVNDLIARERLDIDDFENSCLMNYLLESEKVFGFIK